MAEKNDSQIEYEDREINSVHEYLSWIEEVKETGDKDDEGNDLPLRTGTWYYRGQSCSKWKLIPSLFRCKPPLNEHDLLVKASLRFWKETLPMKSYLEKMIFFQHYGLSTRLLDVTFNPLVALYMACSKKSKESNSGAVYCGCYADAQNLKTAEITAMYVFEKELTSWDLEFDEFAKRNNVKADLFQQPIFIYPPFNNPRIEAQDGAFIMAPLYEKEMLGGGWFWYRKSLDNTDFFEPQRAIISDDNKKSILHELSTLGVNKGTIYKSIEAKMATIMQEAKSKY